MKTITKPAFRKIFLKKIIISITAAITMIVIALTALTLIYRSSSDEYLSSTYNQIENTISKSIEKYRTCISENEFRTLIRSMNFRLSVKLSPVSYDIRNIFCRIIDKDTGEVISDSQERIYFIMKEDTGKGIVYCSSENDAIISEYKRLSDKAEKLGSDYCVECISVYIKDSEIFPCIALLKDAFGSRRIVMESTDYAPNNVENCTYIERTEITYDETGTTYCAKETNDEEYLWCFAGTDKNSRSAKALDSFIEKNGIKEIKTHDSNFKGCYIESYSEYMLFPDGKEHNIYVYFSGTDSFTSDYLLWTIIVCTIILAAAVSIAFLAAKAQYSREEAQYEIFKARRETTTAMTHDLKTPLASISGYAEILNENINPEKCKYYIDKINENVHQMNTTVGNVLKLAKIENFSPELKNENLLVKDIVEELISAMSIMLEKRGLVCNIYGDTTLNTDRNIFSQALLNLLHNAAVYSAENSVIEVKISSKSLKISNIPIQKPKKSAEELMKPFVRENDARGEDQGSGIGLSITQADLKYLGFDLKIEITDKFTAECIF